MPCKGWIYECVDDIGHLKSLGVEISGFKPNDLKGKNGEPTADFDVVVSDAAFAALEPFWMNRYVWGLIPTDQAK